MTVQGVQLRFFHFCQHPKQIEHSGAPSFNVQRLFQYAKVQANIPVIRVAPRSMADPPVPQDSGFSVNDHGVSLCLIL